MGTIRKTLLIADDAEINRDILKMIFEEQYNIIEAEDGEKAINCLKEQGDDIALLFLDLVMPNKNGLEVLDFMKQEKMMEYIPVIMITGEATVESDLKAYEYGASDIIYKPFEPKIVMRRTMNLLELYEHRLDIENKLEARTAELVKSREQIEKSNEFLVNALSSVVEFRSLESGEHIKRVKYFTRILLNNMVKYYPEYKLSKEQVDLIVNAAALHDLGKIAISDSILLKPGKLTPAEFEEMKKHTTYGCELLENFKQEDSEFYRYCYDICRYHHERYDGGGYPDGLKGDEIPIWAQVVSIVDVFDALVSKRVYKQPYVAQEAIRMIREGECGVFSPVIMDLFEMCRVDLFKASELVSFVENNNSN